MGRCIDISQLHKDKSNPIHSLNYEQSGPLFLLSSRRFVAVTCLQLPNAESPATGAEDRCGRQWIIIAEVQIRRLRRAVGARQQPPDYLIRPHFHVLSPFSFF